jgi:inorganic pyrophosphatase
MLACFASLAFAVYLAKWVLAKDEGTADMQEVSDAIREGADGFFATQYNLIGKLAGVVAIAIYLIYSARALTKEQMDAGIGQQTFAILTTFSFCTGALASAASGYVGMWVSVRANVRVAGAARRSAREALMVALRAGGFAAIVVVSMTVLGVSVLFTFYSFMFNVGRPGGTSINEMPLMLVGYGFGASFVALFAQLGGGIYTKAADVGADLVGKVEAGIPEDDPRNPAVIADLVGDNVGDCSARGADLFESIAAEVISAMILGATMAKKAQIADSTGFIMFPLVVHALDCLVSAAGIMSVNERVSLNPRMGGQKEDPYEIIKGGYRVSMGLSIVGFGIATRVMLYVEDAPSAWMHFFACGMVGTASAYAFVFIAQYYTDYKYPPVRVIAEASTTGHGTNIIAGVGVGMESTAAPVICISAAIITAYWFGQTSGLTDKSTGEPTGGLFGTAVATMGMLSTAAYVLTMDVFGPIADNAGGIVEMSDQPESVRECTDALDAVGNTTKATTKGYAIGSAALASFLLFSAYMDEVEAFTGKPFKQVDIAVPEVFVAGLLGSMIVYLFTAFACTAVGRSAQEVVTEVRRQFRERPGIMTREEKPDYGRCVSIVAQSALREMIKPGILAVGGPIVIGVVFRMIGAATGQELLGAKAVAGMLMFATVAGILMALFLNTAGGAWDNAKKYVETGAHGGKGSEAHKAAVTGDTVGDPFKDTAGPSIHVLIKMLATITLVMAPMFLD